MRAGTNTAVPVPARSVHSGRPRVDRLRPQPLLRRAALISWRCTILCHLPSATRHRSGPSSRRKRPLLPRGRAHRRQSEPPSERVAHCREVLGRSIGPSDAGTFCTGLVVSRCEASLSHRFLISRSKRQRNPRDRRSKSPRLGDAVGEASVAGVYDNPTSLMPTLPPTATSTVPFKTFCVADIGTYGYGGSFSTVTAHHQGCPCRQRSRERVAAPARAQRKRLVPRQPNSR
jgi:hypothetical protein